MEFKEVEELLSRYNSDQTSVKEKQLVETWYLKQKPDNQLSENELLEEHDAGLFRLQKHMDKKGLSIKMKVLSAAAVLVVALSCLFIFSNTHEGIKEKMSKANDILPGKNQAIVHFDNGTEVILSESKNGVIINADKLTYDDGSAIAKAGIVNGKQLIVKTPMAGMYKLTLSDGTTVVLNAASTLRFQSVFSGSSRDVELEGEAYFEVSKDKLHPFKVKSNDQDLEVLGTHFNISNYGPENFPKTTLVEGSIQITGARNIVMLKPGQQAKQNYGRLDVNNVDVEAAIAWKNGFFKFDDENIYEVMQEIARWYQIDVHYEKNLTKEGFTGTISRSSNLSDVLDMLERTKVLHFDIEGRKITVLN